MVQYIPPPDPRSLLPPLLASLPTAFASPRPPPVLLPLLSPILRQRVQLLSSNGTASDSWLPLLCWDDEKAAKLLPIVESDDFEMHPVSGEVEFSGEEKMFFRRLDEETLHARVEIADLQLVVKYLWCVADGNGKSEWRVAEVSVLDPEEDMSGWYTSLGQAEEKSREDMMSGALAESDLCSRADEEEEDDDDDYWDRYDATPGRTPARGTPRKPSPMMPLTSINGHTRSTSEDEYLARYSEVQPAMDNEDPSESNEFTHDSTLSGNTLELGSRSGDGSRPPAYGDSPSPPSYIPPLEKADEKQPELSQPRPSSADSSRIERLEQGAESLSQVEIGVKQHISTSIKSLFRLAKVSGIDRAEFDRLIRTELEVLEMLEAEQEH